MMYSDIEILLRYPMFSFYLHTKNSEDNTLLQVKMNTILIITSRYRKI